MSGDEPTFEEISEDVDRVKDARERADDILKSQIRSSAIALFKGLNSHVLNQASDLLVYMDAIYPKCDGQVRTTIHGFRRDIETIRRERESLAEGAFSASDYDIDTPEQHIDRITDFNRRIQQLCPLATRLDNIWNQLNALYDNIRASEEGR